MHLTRVCNKCKMEKPLTSQYFNKEKSNKEGFRNECKVCRSKYNKQYREDNKEKIKESKKKYYHENKEAILAKTKQWREENREYLLKYYKEYAKNHTEERQQWYESWYETNKEHELKRNREWKQNNQEHRAKYIKQWREENKEHVLNYQEEYIKNNRERFIEYGQRRNAKKRELPYTLSLEGWKQIQEDFNYRCAYCGEEKPLEREHFIPLSKGGEYTHNNIIPACKNCNSSKQDSDFFEWFPKQDYYNKYREKKILEYLNYKKGVQQLSIL